MISATSHCTKCDYKDGFNVKDGDFDAAIAAARELRQRLIDHYDKEHGEGAPAAPCLVLQRASTLQHFDLTDDERAQVLAALEKKPRPAWCFTFGCGSPLAKYYVEIEAEDEYQARCRMTVLFSRHWASVYERGRFQPQIAEYGLTRLEINRSATVRLGTNHEEAFEDIRERAYPWDE